MSTDTPTRPDEVTAYGLARDRVRALVVGLDDADAGRTVPATPLWTVRDVVAHLVGVCDDAVQGRLDGAPSDAWTAAQVEARRGRGLAEMVAEWDEVWPAFAELLGQVVQFDPMLAAQGVVDVSTHEQDLRVALGRAPVLDPAAWPLILGMGLTAICDRRDGRGAGPLALVTADGGHHRVGSGEGSPTATLSVDPFELWRAMTGRRSRDQISAWRWTGDWRPDDVCFFPPRDTDLVEPRPVEVNGDAETAAPVDPGAR